MFSNKLRAIRLFNLSSPRVDGLNDNSDVEETWKNYLDFRLNRTHTEKKEQEQVVRRCSTLFEQLTPRLAARYRDPMTIPTFDPSITGYSSSLHFLSYAINCSLLSMELPDDELCRLRCVSHFFRQYLTPLSSLITQSVLIIGKSMALCSLDRPVVVEFIITIERNVIISSSPRPPPRALKSPFACSFVINIFENAQEKTLCIEELHVPLSWTTVSMTRRFLEKNALLMLLNVLGYRQHFKYCSLRLLSQVLMIVSGFEAILQHHHDFRQWIDAFCLCTYDEPKELLLSEERELDCRIDEINAARVRLIDRKKKVKKVYGVARRVLPLIVADIDDFQTLRAKYLEVDEIKVKFIDYEEEEEDDDDEVS